jgi:2-polyprenyl-6-methoxyphenol hydroxylase-like FAD-dependent oxidoreductase
MRNQHAIVLGGGFVGLVVSHMLAEHFSRVTIVERDTLGVAETRPGLPQASHLHTFMLHGQLLLEQLLPGIMAELQSQSLEEIDWAKDTKWIGPFGAYPQYSSGIKSLSFSRIWLDQVILKRVSQTKNIHIVPATVVGIHVHNQHLDTVKYLDEHQVSHSLSADIIIDARGRNSNIGTWLADLGYKVSAPILIKSELGYASCVYQHRTDTPHHFKQIYLQVRALHQPRGVVISCIENRKMMVTALGLGLNKPPRNTDDFQAFLHQLPGQELQDFIGQLEPVGKVSIYRNLLNCHHRFGRMQHWPSGLLVIGDAACLLNPVYGQGMTQAMKQIKLLQSMLPLKSGSERNFQKRIDKLATLPWLMATAEDQRGQRVPLYLRALQRYLDLVLIAAVNQPVIHRIFLQIVHMLKSPYQLFHPVLLTRVLFQRFIPRKY